MENQKQFGGYNAIYNKKTICNTRKHLRAGKRSKQWVAFNSFHINCQYQPMP